MIGSTHETCSVTLFKTFHEEALEQRVRGEFREMPGMRLTLEQAMRMWTMDRQTCSHVLELLVAEHFLEQDRNGRYTRTHAGY